MKDKENYATFVNKIGKHMINLRWTIFINLIRLIRVGRLWWVVRQ